MTITTIPHSTVDAGSIHKLQNFEYADAAARTGAVGLTAANDYQVARQADNETYWILTDYAGPTWLQIGTGVFVSPTFDDIYDHESGLHDILMDDGDVQWRQGGAYSFILDFIAGVGNVDGFFIENGTDFLRLTRKAANNTSLEADLLNIDLDASGTIAIDAVGTIEWSGTNAALTSAGLLFVAGGAVGAPSYSFLADIDTGMYQAGADTIAWALGGVLKASLDGTLGFSVADSLTLTAGGDIKSTLSGDIGIVPHGTGILMVGTGAPGHLTPTSGEAYFQGIVEFDSAVFFDGIASCYNHLVVRDSKYLIFGNSSDVTIGYNLTQTPDTVTVGLSAQSNHIIFCQDGDKGTDFGNALRTDPTTIHQSSDATEVTERGYVSWNEQTIGGGAGSYVGMKSIEEEITVAVGQGGFGNEVDSVANLVPATSRIIQVVSRVTQAPGGGATIVRLGSTNGGNADEYADDTAVALGTTTIASDDGDGVTPIPHWQTAADTMRIGTDADVTISDMKIRVVVFYEEITVPTA